MAAYTPSSLPSPTLTMPIFLTPVTTSDDEDAGGKFASSCVAGDGSDPGYCRVAHELVAHFANDTSLPPLRSFLSATFLRCCITGDINSMMALLKIRENAWDDTANPPSRSSSPLLGPNETDPHTGMSALMMAASNGHLPVARRLIELGADVNLQDKVGWTALLWALNRNQIAVAELLVTRGRADVSRASLRGYDARKFLERGRVQSRRAFAAVIFGIQQPVGTSVCSSSSRISIASATSMSSMLSSSNLATYGIPNTAESAYLPRSLAEFTRFCTAIGVQPPATLDALMPPPPQKRKTKSAFGEMSNGGDGGGGGTIGNSNSSASSYSSNSNSNSDIGEDEDNDDDDDDLDIADPDEKQKKKKRIAYEYDFDWDDCRPWQMLVFQASDLPLIFQAVLRPRIPSATSSNKENASLPPNFSGYPRRPESANFVFLLARYAAAYDPDLLEPLLAGLVARLRSECASSNAMQADIPFVAYWLANSARLLFLLRRDPMLHQTSQVVASLTDLSDVVGTFYNLLLTRIYAKLDPVLDDAIIDFNPFPTSPVSAKPAATPAVPTAFSTTLSATRPNALKTSKDGVNVPNIVTTPVAISSTTTTTGSKLSPDVAQAGPKASSAKRFLQLFTTTFKDEFTNNAKNFDGDSDESDDEDDDENDEDNDKSAHSKSLPSAPSKATLSPNLTPAVKLPSSPSILSGGSGQKRTGSVTAAMGIAKSTVNVPTTPTGTAGITKSSAAGVTPQSLRAILSGAYFVLRYFQNHVSIIHQFLEQVFYRIGASLFAQLLRAKEIDSWRAMQIRMNVSQIEEWIRNAQLPTLTSLDCYTRHLRTTIALVQLLQVLSYVKSPEGLLDAYRDSGLVIEYGWRLLRRILDIQSPTDPNLLLELRKVVCEEIEKEQKNSATSSPSPPNPSAPVNQTPPPVASHPQTESLKVVTSRTLSDVQHSSTDTFETTASPASSSILSPTTGMRAIAKTRCVEQEVLISEDDNMPQYYTYSHQDPGCELPFVLGGNVGELGTFVYRQGIERFLDEAPHLDYRVFKLYTDAYAKENSTASRLRRSLFSFF